MEYGGVQRQEEEKLRDLLMCVQVLVHHFVPHVVRLLGFLFPPTPHPLPFFLHLSSPSRCFDRMVVIVTMIHEVERQQLREVTTEEEEECKCLSHIHTHSSVTKVKGDGFGCVCVCA